MRRAIFIFLILFTSCVLSQEVRIGLYGTQPIHNVIITPSKGEYKVFADGRMLAFLDIESVVQLLSSGDSVLVKINNGEQIQVSKVLIHSPDSSHFKIRSVNPDVAVKSFFGAIEVTAIKNSLKTVNVTDLEVYIAGVVESEVGPKAPPEYYKSQAILCRTYALGHYRRHEAEGFQLCDRVHCQAYKSRSVKNPAILEAVRRTKGLVLVDDKLELITAAFHSNCGGQTANSEDVWNKNVSYLRSVKDTFCLREPNAKWVKEIPAEKWFTHMSNVCSYPVQDSSYTKLICSVEPLSRITYLGDSRHAIPTRELRTDFNLKSAYFGVSKVDDKIMLKGKGYGHGVGLCQEGAMRMARLGYSYSKILHFYFTAVNIVNLNELDFFKHE